MCDCGKTGTGQYLGTIGGQIGDKIQNTGMALIQAGQKRFKAWTGLGDYTIKYNSLINGSHEMSAPIVTSTERGIRVRYREYLGEVYTPSIVGTFSVFTYPLNPANDMTFPWLSAIAGQFEQYKPHGIIFEFKSTATDYVNTGASLGVVATMTDYNVNDSPPTALAQMLNSAYSTMSKASEDQAHGVEYAPAELQNNVYYCRPTGSTAADKQNYDIGNFNIAVSGGSLAVNSSIGSLFVNYDFEFIKQTPRAGPPFWGNHPEAVLLSNSYNGKTGTWNVITPADNLLRSWNFLQTGGHNFGITFTTQAPGFRFPISLYPYVIRIEMYIRYNAAFAPATPTLGVGNNLILAGTRSLESQILSSNFTTDAFLTAHQPELLVGSLIHHYIFDFQMQGQYQDYGEYTWTVPPWNILAAQKVFMKYTVLNQDFTHIFN